MKTIKQKLTLQLESKGWNVDEIYKDDLEWWADEIWKLKSQWSPEGVPAFITFLVDPQSEGERKKDQEVWGVGNSESFPTTRNEAESNGAFSLGSNFEFENILNQIEKLRSCAINDLGL